MTAVDMPTSIDHNSDFRLGFISMAERKGCSHGAPFAFLGQPVTAWITQLNMRHFFMLRDLAEALGMTPDALALHLLEREHGRVFGTGADEDEVTLPNNSPPENA